MTTTTFVIFGVIAIIFSILSFIQTGLIRSQKEVIVDLKGENQHLKTKNADLQERLNRYEKGVIEDV